MRQRECKTEVMVSSYGAPELCRAKELCDSHAGTRGGEVRREAAKSALAQEESTGA